MRQAFQIRLSQLEKRYQRQLILEQSKHQQSPLSGAVVRRRDLCSSSSSASSISQNHHSSSDNGRRRNSWHSYIASSEELEKLAEPDVVVMPTTGSEGEGGDASDVMVDSSDQGSVSSCSSESSEEDISAVPATTVGGGGERRKGRSIKFAGEGESGDSHVNELPESHRDHSKGLIHSTPNKEGLKGGSKSWKEESSDYEEIPQLSPISDELNAEEVGASIDEEARRLIQHKIREYREKMMKYFQEKSEAQISVIEKKYKKQMDEVKRRYSEKATEKMSHLTTRIKDLETRLDVQTLV